MKKTKTEKTKRRGGFLKVRNGTGQVRFCHSKNCPKSTPGYWHFAHD